MIEWFGPIVHEYYSSTEGYLFTAITSEEALARPGSVGQPLLGTPHILDDDGDELPPGEPGHDLVGGRHRVRLPQRPREDRRRAQRPRLDDGRRHRLPRRRRLPLPHRPQGRHDHLGRREHLSAGGRERAGHPSGGRRRRRSSASRTTELGEQVKAVVQPLSMDDAGRRRSRPSCSRSASERLAKYKCPRAIDFRAELPRHPTGKLYKRLLRDEYAGRA